MQYVRRTTVNAQGAIRISALRLNAVQSSSRRGTGRRLHADPRNTRMYEANRIHRQIFKTAVLNFSSHAGRP
jgi:hypothetical protein